MFLYHLTTLIYDRRSVLGNKNMATFILLLCFIGVPNGGVVARKLVWPHHCINVCWENYNYRFERHYLIVQNAIRNSWEKHSKIKFLGWDECLASSMGIRIFVNDTTPHGQLGTSINGVKNGMYLNFEFKNFHVVRHNFCRSNRHRLQMCIRDVATHEFGHALALRHEQN